MTPNLSTGGNTAGQFQQFSIRGVTQNDITDIVEPPNAVYVDEAYMPAAQTQVFGLLDIERVEVLRGPQGTLFDRNATGGLVHYVTRSPTNYRDGFVDVTYGSYNQIRMEGAMGGPLTDTLSVRLAGLYSRHDSILKNTVAGAPDFWNDNQWNFRGKIRWKADNLDVLLSGFYAGSAVSTAAYQSIPSTGILDASGQQINSIYAKNDPLGCTALLSTGGCVALPDVPTLTRPVQGADFFGHVDPDGSGLRTGADFADERINRVYAYGSTGHVSYDMGDVTLTSISHYVFSKKTLPLDVDATPAAMGVLVAGPTFTKSFTQEVRLNGNTEPLTWVAGLYYLHNMVDYQTGFSVIPAGIDGVAQAELTTSSYSIFAQGEYAFNDQYALILGGRFIHDDQDYHYRALVTQNDNDGKIDYDTIFDPAARPPYSDKRGQSLWAGRLQFNYKPNTNTLLYASVNRGAKAGSYNAQSVDPNPALAPADIPFNPEALYAYEAGVKIAQCAA